VINLKCGAGSARRLRGVLFMRKSVFAFAVIAAACSSVAFAGEVKKDKAQVPAVKATTLSDADMDKVTAGAFIVTRNHTVFPNWSGQGQANAGHGFRGQGGSAARFLNP